MSLKKMMLLAREIDRLRDNNQRLIIENDLLRKKIKLVEAETTDQILMQDISRLDVEIKKLSVYRAA